MTEVNHDERAHSPLGPSASGKWINCAAALATEAKFLELNPDYDDSNPAAEEGTEAHELADTILQSTDPISEDDYADVPAEMLRHTLRYVDYCLATGEDDPKAIRATEQRLRMPRIHEDAYGTGDYSVYTPSDKTLHVIDYKYGQGVFVEVNGNTQMLMYGEGAREYLYNEYGEVPERYVLHVYQPRMDNIATWEITAEELEDFVAFANTRAAMTRSLPDKYTPGEKQCRWCIAKPICEAYKDYCLNIATSAFDDIGDTDPDQAPGLLKKGVLTDEQVGELLSKWDDITRMGEALKSYAHARALQGIKIPGFKLVDGRSSYAPREAELEFILGDEIYKEPSILSKTALKKKVGAKRFKLVENLYKESKGAPTLASSDDRRKEWQPETYADEFGD